MGCSQSSEPRRKPGAPKSIKRKGKGPTQQVMEAREGGDGAGAGAGAGSEELKVMTVEEMANLGKLEDSYDVEDKVLGTGQFAVVKPCVKKENGMKCAVKMINISGTSQERLALEIDILKRIKGHPNIVGLYDVFVTKDQVQLVLEYVVGGELFDYLVEQGPYSESEAAYHMRRIVSAVDYLHRHGVVHRDLKPENILLTSKDPRRGEIKIADFGLARMWSEEAMETVCGTWAYCAPEVRNDPKGYGPKVDIWSIGVILFVLLAAYHPFDPRGDASEDEMWYNAEEGKYNFDDPAWEGVSREAKDLIRRMIVVVPADRYSSEDVLAHPWMTSFNQANEPLSSRINIDLKDTKNRYAREKIAGAGKAAWAAMALSSALKSPSSPKAKAPPVNIETDQDGDGDGKSSSATGDGEGKESATSPEQVVVKQ